MFGLFDVVICRFTCGRDRVGTVIGFWKDGRVRVDFDGHVYGISPENLRHADAERAQAKED
jgi:hypothetical protein